MKVFVYTKLKGQSRYLREWTEWYKGLGFDGIIIHNNNPSLSDPLFIDPFIWYIDKTGEEWVYQQPDTPLPHYFTTQTLWSNEVLSLLKNEYPDEECWMLNTDIDEFIDKSIQNIKQYISKYKNVYQHFFWWEYYDDNNQLVYNDLPVTQRFTHKSKYQPVNFIRDFQDNPDRPLFFYEGKSMVEVHHSDPWLCVHGTKEVYAPEEVEPDIRIRHYYTRSLEEWFSQKIPNSMTGTSLRRPDIVKTYFEYNDITDEKILYIYDYVKRHDIRLTDADRSYLDYRRLLMELERNGNTDIFCTYHMDSIPEEYSLEETAHFHLFPTHKDRGYLLDGMGPYLNEYCTMYYVWKHPQLLRNRFVGFCHYRRMFSRIIPLKDNQVQVYEVMYSTLNTFRQEVATVNGKNEINKGIKLLGKIFIEFIVNNDRFAWFRKRFFINDGLERAYPYKEIFIMPKADFMDMMEDIHPLIEEFIRYLHLSYRQIRNHALEKNYGRYVGDGIARRLIGYLIELYVIKTWISFRYSKENVLI